MSPADVLFRALYYNYMPQKRFESNAPEPLSL